jgi:hypothetical protein
VDANAVARTKVRNVTPPVGDLNLSQKRVLAHQNPSLRKGGYN